jgi:putative endonuclease
MPQEKFAHKVKKSCEAENLIAQTLVNQGWRILARNFRIVGAELDLVAQKGGTLAIVEVKARAKKPGCLADAETLLPQRKRNALQRGGLAYLSKIPQIPATIRFDLAIVWRGGTTPLSIEYIVNAF